MTTITELSTKVWKLRNRVTNLENALIELIGMDDMEEAPTREEILKTLKKNKVME